jgi:predicted peptidase
MTLVFGSGWAVAQDVKQLLEIRTFTGANGAKLHYRLLKPDRYDATRKYPLVVFLHGAGERGDDNTVQMIHGVPQFASESNRAKYPCFLIAPQCPRDRRWVEVDWSSRSHDMPKSISEPLGLTMELIDTLPKEFSIDTNRQYITGLSMGGYGTWDAMARRPGLFAAAAPICGGGDIKTAPAIAKIPIWAFHGAKDRAVVVERSRDMIDAIKKAGGSPRYTEYSEVGHDSWVPAYRDAELFAWMFAQKKD